MNKIIALARIINDAPATDLASLPRDDALDALLAAMRELADIPEVAAAIRRLDGHSPGNKPRRVGSQSRFWRH